LQSSEKRENEFVKELQCISTVMTNLETRVANQQRDLITELTTMEIAELGAIRHKMRQCSGALGTFAEHAMDRIG
jgi:hypothetical protein